MRYRAFLSYSHKDQSLARWLLRKLEGYRVPARLVGTRGYFGVIPARLGSVFRDRDELPTAADLGSTITAALDDSEALVVVCSPAAARSRWVNAEIQAFRASGRGDRIYCYVVDGDPASRDDENCCFPPALPAQRLALCEVVIADAEQSRHQADERSLAPIADAACVGSQWLA